MNSFFMWHKDQILLKYFNINVENNKDFWEKIKTTVMYKEKRSFQYLNSHSYYLANKCELFYTALKNADYLRAGGISILLANKYLKLFSVSLEKVAFNHFFFHFEGDKLLSHSGYRIFLLGSTSETLETIFTNNFCNKNKLNLIKNHHGYFSEDKDNEVVFLINESKVNILLVGLGTPKSDYWIVKNKKFLNNMAIISVGNFFDIWAGKTRIAPRILFNSPFEWIFRLIQSPNNLLLRYLFSNTYFILRMLRNG